MAPSPEEGLQVMIAEHPPKCGASANEGEGAAGRRGLDRVPTASRPLCSLCPPSSPGHREDE